MKRVSKKRFVSMIVLAFVGPASLYWVYASKAMAEVLLPSLNCEAIVDDEMGDENNPILKVVCQALEATNRELAVLRMLIANQSPTDNNSELSKAIKVLPDGFVEARRFSQRCEGGSKAKRWDRNNHCYVRFDTASSFESASRSCHEQGAHLVSQIGVLNLRILLV